MFQELDNLAGTFGGFLQVLQQFFFQTKILQFYFPGLILQLSHGQFRGINVNKLCIGNSDFYFFVLYKINHANKYFVSR